MCEYVQVCVYNYTEHSHGILLHAFNQFLACVLIWHFGYH